MATNFDPNAPKTTTGGVTSYNPLGSFGSTFKPLSYSAPEEDPNKPKTQTATQQQPQPAPQQAPTFAQMQAAGQARPAPPPVPYGGQLNQTISQALANPSAYGTPQVMDAYQRMSADIDDEFTRKNGALTEELARRGLGAVGDSTIGSGRGYELNVERRSAKADLADRLMQQMAQTYGADRAAAIAAGLQGANQANSNALNWAQLGQQGSQFGQSLGLQRELGLGNLGIAQGDLALRGELGKGEMGLNQQRLAQEGALSREEMGLRQAMQSRDLTAQEQQQLRALTAQRESQQSQQGFEGQQSALQRALQLQMQGNALGDSAADRSLRAQLGLGELGLSQQRLGLDTQTQLGQLSLAQQDQLLRGELGRGELGLNQQRLAQEGSQFGQSLGFQREQLASQREESGLDRQLQQLLGMGQLDVSRGDLALRGELGRGELGINQQKLGLDAGDLDLRRTLGMGNLDLSRQQLSENTRQSDLDRSLRSTLGLGELDLNRQQLAQQGQQFQQDLGLRSELGRGELGLNRDKLSADQQNAGLDRALRETLGMGELGINQQRTNNDLTLGRNQLLGSVLNTLMNSNVDLSKLPAGFLDSLMGQVNGRSGGTTGGTTGGTNGGRPPGWWRPGGGSGGIGQPVTGTPAGSGGTAPNGATSPAPYTPQWQQDPSSGQWVDAARPGELWTGNQPGADPYAGTDASGRPILDYDWLRGNSMGTGTQAGTLRPDSISDQSRYLSDYLAGENYFDTDINRGYQDARSVAQSLGIPWETYKQSAANMGFVYDDQGRIVSQPDRRVTGQADLSPDGNFQSFAPHYFSTDLNQYGGDPARYFQMSPSAGKSYDGFLQYLQQRLGGG